MVIIKYLKTLLFDWRMKHAIREARKKAGLYDKKFMVIVFDKKPVCISAQAVKSLIRRKRFAKGVTYDTILQKAVYVAFPNSKKGG